MAWRKRPEPKTDSATSGSFIAMDREEAARALDLLKKVVGQARDESTLEKWGAIWILNGMTNGAGFVATHFLFRAGYTSVVPFAALWAGILSLNLSSIIFLKRGSSAGARTFVESQIWSIWTTFIVSGVVAAFVNLLLGLDRMFVAPVMSILAMAAFSAMGGIMGKRWYALAALFGVMALVMAALPEVQFLILAGLWGAGQSGAGVYLLMERRKRLAAQGGIEPRLV
jgi:hypothetical protein